jgi:hypothetical protein
MRGWKEGGWNDGGRRKGGGLDDYGKLEGL